MLIAFDGLDCSGKTTQISLLRDKLIKLNKKPLIANSLKCSPLGDIVSTQLKHGNINPNVRAILAIATQIINSTGNFAPLIKLGYMILADRYFMSTYLYEGVRNKLDTEIDWDYWSSLLPKPDIQIFMYCSPEAFRERLEARNRRPDLVELSLTDNVIHKLINRMEELCNPDKNIFTIDTTKLNQEDLTNLLFNEIINPRLSK